MQEVFVCSPKNSSGPLVVFPDKKQAKEHYKELEQEYTLSSAEFKSKLKKKSGPRSKGKCMYPLQDMNIGGSHLVVTRKYSHTRHSAILSVIYNWKKRNLKFKNRIYTTRKEGYRGVRIYRVK